MARIFDVVEYADEMRDEIVHRFPETGSGDFRIGSQVIVREAQSVVFFRDGKALDTFGPGRHTITTANIPLLVDLIGKAFGDRTPFTAEVYFVSMREFADQKWGTAQPIIVRNPGMGLGVALMQGYGSYAFQIANPQQFVAQIVGLVLEKPQGSQPFFELIAVLGQIGNHGLLEQQRPFTDGIQKTVDLDLQLLGRSEDHGHEMSPPRIIMAPRLTV